jgi:hypothetical protein
MIVDVIQLRDTTHDYSDATGVVAGLGPETIDGDFDTYWGIFYQQGGGGSSSRTFRSLHNFIKSFDIDRIVFKCYINATTNSGASANRASASCKVEVYRDGAWEDVAGSSGSVSASGDKTSQTTIDVDLTDLDLTDVEDIRGYGYVWAQQDGSGGGQRAWCNMYELQAYADVPVIVQNVELE